MPNDPFYHTAEWREFRRKFLARFPVCAVPGCGAAATNVDHIVSRRRGGLPFDPYNCQALCQSHHSQKTALQDRPSYASSDRPLRVKGCDAAGWPLDPRHGWRQTG